MYSTNNNLNQIIKTFKLINIKKIINLQAIFQELEIRKIGNRNRIKKDKKHNIKTECLCTVQKQKIILKKAQLTMAAIKELIKK